MIGDWGVARILPFFEVAAAALVVFLTQVAWYSRHPPTPNSVYVQVLLDVGLASVLVGLTGGTLSIASYLYFPSIVAAPFLLGSGQAGVLSLTTAGFCSVGLTIASLMGPHVSEDPLQWVSDLIMRVLAFFLVAMLIDRYSRVSQEAIEAEQKAAAALALEHSAVLKQVRAGVLSTDASGKVVTANPAAIALLGSPIGKSIGEIFPASQTQERWEEQRKGIFACSRTTLPSGGWVVVVDDITELYQMREQAAKDERFAAMGRLAAAVAHEIRNPLSSVSGCLQLMAEDPKNRPARLALQETNRLNRLVEDFLQAARTPTLHLEVVDLVALIHEVADALLLDPRFTDRIDIRVESTPSTTQVDRDRFQQVLWNLMINAAQSMPSKGEIRVSVRPREGGISIQVSDQGVGIPVDEIGRIFDPFYTTRAGGTGIGLSMVNQIIRGHKGKISVSLNEPPVPGTTFDIWIPTSPLDA